MSETFDIRKYQPEKPYAFIQWKGTDACMDVYCTCGEGYHFDGYFAYAFRCGACGQAFEVVPFVALVPVEKTNADPIVLRDEE